MFSSNPLYRPENFKLCLEYHRELLKVAQQARQEVKSPPSIPTASHKWNWFQRYFLARRQEKHVVHT